MTGDGTPTRQSIPQVMMCENVGAYSKEQIRAIAEHLRSTQPWGRLHGAARGWRSAGGSLELVSTTLREVSRSLAAGCQSQDAAACQRALQQLDATARHLADRSERLYQYTNSSAEALASGSEKFPTDSPGFGERLLGGTVGGAIDRINPFHSGPSEEDYQRALGALNSELSAVNASLPDHVSALLPNLEGSESGSPDTPDEPTEPDDGGSTGGSSGSDGGGEGTVMPGVPEVGGVSAGAATPGFMESESDGGVTGGLSGVGGLAAPPPGPVAGGGVPPGGVPTAPTAPGGVPAAGAAVAGPAVAGSGRPATMRPGVIGAPGGSQAAGTAAGRGAAPAGAGGRANATPGVTGQQTPRSAGGTGAAGTGRAAGAGGTGSGAGRAAGAAGARGGAPAPVTGAGRRNDGGSDRDTWLTEDEDLWADPAVAPSVIE